MKIFGEDGFRDLFQKGLLEDKFLNKFFSALNIFLEKQKIKEVLIGYDTRFSSNYLINLITKNLNLFNFCQLNIYYCGYNNYYKLMLSINYYNN